MLSTQQPWHGHTQENASCAVITGTLHNVFSGTRSSGALERGQPGVYTCTSTCKTPKWGEDQRAGGTKRPQEGTAAQRSTGVGAHLEQKDLGTSKQKLQLVECKQLLPALPQEQNTPRNQLGVNCLQQPSSARKPTF